MKVIYHPWHYTDPVVFYLFYISWHELSDILVCVWVNIWNCHYQLRSVHFHLISGAITLSCPYFNFEDTLPRFTSILICLYNLYGEIVSLWRRRTFWRGPTSRKVEGTVCTSMQFFFNQSYKVLPSNKMALRIIKMSLTKEKKSKRIKQKIQHWKEKRMEKWCIMNYNQNFNKMKLAYQNSWSKIKT